MTLSSLQNVKRPTLDYIFSHNGAQTRHIQTGLPGQYTLQTIFVETLHILLFFQKCTFHLP